MVDWFLETGLYLLGVALIPAVGLLLVAWGLWGDRSKGRTRCPKCGYDMRGSLPRLECPECGHDAKQERRLYRNHRRWGHVAVGVALILLSSYPLTVVGGWCREQLAVRALAKRGHGAVRSGPTRPDWVVGRLPEPVARLFDRAAVVHLRQPGTDGGLVHLKGLPHVETLYLHDTQVTDAGLAHLKGLSQLRFLWLDGTQVTDAGLAHLKGLPQLRFLWLDGTQVTDAGVAKLEQALPNVEVVRH